MMKFALLFVVASVGAMPQYQSPSSGGPPPAAPPAPAPAAAAPPSYTPLGAQAGAAAASPAPAAAAGPTGPADSSSSSSSSSSGGSSGGNLQTDCKPQEVSPGNWKFVCDGVNPESLSLRSEHILWLQGPQGQQQVVDIEVPNYKIQELIKAGFKGSGDSKTQINVKLRKPEQSYDAQVDQPSQAKTQPAVKLQYEPIQPVKVHYPVDKPYSPLQGPLVPPGGGAPATTSSASSSAGGPPPQGPPSYSRQARFF